MFKFFQVIFRKIADVKRERELAETRKNEGLDQIGSDHPVRKLISKFRKISQENRAASQNASNIPTPPPPPQPSSSQQTSPATLPTIIQPISITTTESNESSPTTNLAPTPPQHLQLPSTATTATNVKSRDKLETISERIETQESQVSQITSLNQSPPLQRPPKSSKWKWLKTGSTEPEIASSPKGNTTNNQTLQQQSTNPFDSNVNNDQEENERRLSIPLSLFIPRSARSDGTKELDEEHSSDHVKKKKKSIFNYFFKYFLFFL